MGWDWECKVNEYNTGLRFGTIGDYSCVSSVTRLRGIMLFLADRITFLES